MGLIDELIVFVFFQLKKFDRFAYSFTAKKYFNEIRKYRNNNIVSTISPNRKLVIFQKGENKYGTRALRECLLVSLLGIPVPLFGMSKISHAVFFYTNHDQNILFSQSP